MQLEDLSGRYKTQLSRRRNTFMGPERAGLRDVVSFGYKATLGKKDGRVIVAPDVSSGL